MARNYAKNSVSPIEQKLLDVLSDGKVHSREALKLCLSDEELTADEAIKMQISNLRKILRPQGRDIVLWGTGHYRMMRLLNDEE